MADRLLSSLGGEPLSDVDVAWVAEAESRYAEFKSGIRQPIPATKVFEEADRILTCGLGPYEAKAGILA